MQFQRVIFGMTFGLLFGFLSGMGTVTAQSLSKAGGPKELPPSNYKGRQFVDSAGCVYVRAGFSGNVTWVPRVAKNRNVICGFKPTFGGTQVVTAPRPAPKQAPRPVVIPQVKAPKQVVRRPQAKAPRQAQVADPCKPASGLARPFGGTKTGNCGDRKTRVVFPDGVQPVAIPAVPRAPLATSRMGTTTTVRTARPVQTTVRTARITIPAPVAAPLPARVPLAVPKGYKRAWTDDRLNSNRGRGTALGAAQMARVWTNELPRQLVSETTQVRRTKAVRTKVRTSSKSPQANMAGTASHRFVQVGVYGQPRNAQKSIAVLRQMKLPVRMGSFQREGKTLQIVVAGPFRSQAELSRALGAARSAGFSDAVLRK